MARTTPSCAECGQTESALIQYAADNTGDAVVPTDLECPDCGADMLIEILRANDKIGISLFDSIEAICHEDGESWEYVEADEWHEIWSKDADGQRSLKKTKRIPEKQAESGSVQIALTNLIPPSVESTE